MRWRGNRPGTGVWKTLQTLFNGHGKHFLFHVGYFCIQDICVWIVGLQSWETSPVILIGRILLSHSGITVLKFVIVHFCRALFEDFCGTLLRDITRRSCAAPLSICLMWQPCGSIPWDTLGRSCCHNAAKPFAEKTQLNVTRRFSFLSNQHPPNQIAWN